MREAMLARLPESSAGIRPTDPSRPVEVSRFAEAAPIDDQHASMDGRVRVVPSVPAGCSESVRSPRLPVEVSETRRSGNTIALCAAPTGRSAKGTLPTGAEFPSKPLTSGAPR